MTVFSKITTDTVSLIKKNGEQIDKIKASVQPEWIFIFRSDILIESGDLIQRVMSNGGNETYRVIDPGFQEKIMKMPAHYQIKHEKLGLPEAEKTIQSITYNISGSNARVNNNSIDSSTNTVNFNSEFSEQISSLRKEITEFVQSAAEKKEALEVVDEIEKQLESQSPSKAVLNSLLRALPDVGSVASIVSLILSFIK